MHAITPVKSALCRHVVYIATYWKSKEEEIMPNLFTECVLRLVEFHSQQLGYAWAYS